MGSLRSNLWSVRWKLMSARSFMNSCTLTCSASINHTVSFQQQATYQWVSSISYIQVGDLKADVDGETDTPVYGEPRCREFAEINGRRPNVKVAMNGKHYSVFWLTCARANIRKRTTIRGSLPTTISTRSGNGVISRTMS